MPDIDVAAVALVSPPQPAYLTQYRPSVSVKNNGVSNAVATGYLRIYKAGQLVFTTQLYSGTIPAGQTRLAEADTYWTPATTGTYIVQGYVSCTRDMVEPNNNLAPVTLLVQGGEPPPPPIVTAHAAQHEEGGTDPVNVEGLEGVLADRQRAALHHTDHEAGEDDEIDLSGLSGEAATPQVAKTHGNDRHSTAFATGLDIANHNSSPTAHATILQKLSEKGAASGYAPLGADSKVPTANLPPLSSGLAGVDDQMAPISPGASATTLCYAHLGTDLEKGRSFDCIIDGAVSAGGMAGTVTLRVHIGRFHDWTDPDVTSHEVTFVPASPANSRLNARFRVALVDVGGGSIYAFGSMLEAHDTPIGPAIAAAPSLLTSRDVDTADDNYISLSVQTAGAGGCEFQPIIAEIVDVSH